MSNLHYLMTGGHGRLGTELRKHLPCDAPTHQDLDILDTGMIDRHISKASYAAVIHLAAITEPAMAAKNPRASYRTNVLGTRNLAQASARHGLMIYYLSTDYVFDGREGNYKENDRPAPANWYGTTKYAGELEIQEATSHYGIIRTSFRPAQWPFPTAFTNVYTSADYTDVIAAEVSSAITRKMSGVLHIGTPTKTFFELAQQRNPHVMPEECKDDAFPKKRNLNIEKWLSMRKKSLRA